MIFLLAPREKSPNDLKVQFLTQLLKIEEKQDEDIS